MNEALERAIGNAVERAVNNAITDALPGIAAAVAAGVTAGQIHACDYAARVDKWPEGINGRAAHAAVEANNAMSVFAESPATTAKTLDRTAHVVDASKVRTD